MKLCTILTLCSSHCQYKDNFMLHACCNISTYLRVICITNTLKHSVHHVT